jgi:RNA polymerase sigma factor (sigma-70 family)
MTDLTNSTKRSFERFYEEVKDRVWQTLLVTGRDPTRAEDAVAEAFARAFERWESVGLMDNPVGWVVQVAVNRFNSDWRIWRRELPEPPPDAAATDPASFDADLARLVWSLPRRQRQVVALRVIADLSEDETGRILRISPKTVSVHLHRALGSLRQDMKAQRMEDEPWKTQTSPLE